MKKKKKMKAFTNYVTLTLESKSLIKHFMFSKGFLAGIEYEIHLIIDESN